MLYNITSSNDFGLKSGFSISINSTLNNILVVFLFLLSIFALISGVTAENFNSNSSPSDIQNFLNVGSGDDELVLDEGDYVNTLYNWNV